MKNYYICFILFCLTGAIVTAQPFNIEVGADGSSKHLLGKINKDGLTNAHYAGWFQKNYNEYQPRKEIVSALKGALNAYTIELFMGTWCGDSKREVPRFYKILDEVQFPLERLTAIAVDRKKAAYKQSPGGEHEGKNIHRVPTFILYKNGVEVNRIVEHPVESLEEDLLNILKGNYTPNYEAVERIRQALSDMGVATFSKKEKKLAKTLKPIAKGVGELNTYAYLLFNLGKTEEAMAVARLNLRLFPEEIRAYTRMASQLELSGDVEAAKEWYSKALEIDPENKRVKDALESLNNRMAE